MGKYRYGVILDAGSSGTRVYVYKWLNNARARKNATKETLSSLPELLTHKKWTMKSHPGISTFNLNPEEVGEKHLKPLIDHALKHVPKDEVENTPFFLLATAGMRLLPNSQKDKLLQEVCAYVSDNTKLQIPDCEAHVQVIKGETEGLYGWVAANYLLGGFDEPEANDHGKDHHTYGFLDMGGASAQIAFAPNATEAAKHAEDLKMLRLRTIGGTAEEYRVFVTTWLGFGANEARRRYIKALEESTDKTVMELPDPCIPAGLKVTEAGQPIMEGSDEALGKKPHLIGTGKFSECLRQTYPLLAKDKPCLDTPCLINGQHVPAIDFDVNHFVGVSEYWHTTHEVFEMSNTDKAYDFHTYQERVNQFCNQPWSAIEKGIAKHKWGKKVDTQKATEVCFKASWLINMLHDGIGVPRKGLEPLGESSHNTTKHLIESAKAKGFLDPFQAVDKINDVEVSWTLGKMVLYASSQIPPPTSSATYDQFLPVGFGSNTPGVAIPPDFQHAGGKDFSVDDDLSDIGLSEVDWHDTLFHDSPRRIPGLLLFLAIIIVALFLLCGRERRSNLYNRILASLGISRKRSSRFSSRLGKAFPFSRPDSPSYDRLDNLESGRDLDARDFELPTYESDHSSDSENGTSSSRAGKTSGWATPTLAVDGSDTGVLSPSKRGYFTEGAGLAASLAAVGKDELLSRTASRESLARARSRGASPRPNGKDKRSL